MKASLSVLLYPYMDIRVALSVRPLKTINGNVGVSLRPYMEVLTRMKEIIGFLGPYSKFVVYLDGG